MGISQHCGYRETGPAMACSIPEESPFKTKTNLHMLLCLLSVALLALLSLEVLQQEWVCRQPSCGKLSCRAWSHAADSNVPPSQATCMWNL